MALTLNHQTASQFAARLREYYRNATREECARLAKWILDRIDVGDITDNQVRNAFNMTVTEYTIFKNKLIDLRSRYETIMAARGE